MDGGMRPIFRDKPCARNPLSRRFLAWNCLALIAVADWQLDVSSSLCQGCQRRHADTEPSTYLALQFHLGLAVAVIRFNVCPLSMKSV